MLIGKLRPGDTFSCGIHPLIRLDGYNDRNDPLVTVLEGDYAGWVGFMTRGTSVENVTRKHEEDA